ncbi:MAG: serine/threonine-protein kinase [Bacteroidota bacterium]
MILSPGTRARRTMQTLGKYHLREPLGQGGMGTVYRAFDPVIEREVALKVIHPHVLNVPNVRERFLREARTAGRLTHDNILTVYDFGAVGNQLFIVMELLPGYDLDALLHRTAQFPVAQVTAIGMQLADALAYAHRLGVVHRDLKPGNVRLLTDGRVKLMDFGLARLEAAGGTVTNSRIGTPRYMAPELVRGETIDHRADVFSLGCVLYELLAGRPAFSGDQISQILYQLVNVQPADLRTLRPDIPPELAAVVMQCLSKDPAQRPMDAQALRMALAAIHASLTQPNASGIRPLPPPPTAVKPRLEPVAERTRATSVPLVFGILLVIALVAGFIYFVRGFEF